ncbi:MAG: LamG domain-containing protein [Candidatus Saccharimonas sp.]
MKRGILGLALLSLMLTGLFVDIAVADRYTSTSYVIDASVMNTAGGDQSSTTYRLTSSIGETAVGNGASGSYKMGYGYINQLDKSIALTVQPSGLVASYELDETTGTIFSDNSIYGAYGTGQNAPSSVSGKLDNARSFNGTSQSITVGNNTQTQLTTATVEVWVKSTITTGSQAAVAKASNFWLGLGGGKASTYDWPTATTTTDTTVIADGNWHHIAITVSSGVASGSTLYVDGVAKKTFTWAPVLVNGWLAIGTVTSNGSSYIQYFNGSIDHAKIFNRMLSADEIAAEYSSQDAGYGSGLTLGTITPGASNTALSDIVVETDNGGYTLAVNQNTDLTSGAFTIPSISGSIASPVSWTEGTTKGLGFTLTATNATAIPGTWSSGNSYAPLPSTATSFYTRTGLQSSTADYLTMRLRADVDTTQPTTSGAYSNIMTITGTTTP